jgi:hypothetical protein
MCFTPPAREKLIENHFLKYLFSELVKKIGTFCYVAVGRKVRARKQAEGEKRHREPRQDKPKAKSAT